MGEGIKKLYKSLIFKIILCCVVLTLCLIGSIVGVLYGYQHSILSEMEKKSSEILEVIQVEITNMDIGNPSNELVERRLDDIKKRHGVEAIILYDDPEQAISKMSSEEQPVLEFAPPLYEAYVTNVEEADGRRTTQYLQTFPLMIGDNQVGHVRIWLSIAPQTHIVKALQSKILLSLILLFLGTIGVLCYLIFKLLHPLHTMAVTCSEISEGNLHEIDIEPNASEVLTLEMKFNEMVRALKTKAIVERKLAQAERLSALGNLAAGVAHEIGNPLNGIKLTITHLKNITPEGRLDEASLDNYIDTILGEVNRLDEIIRNFLMLAKEREPLFRRCSIDKVVRDSVRLIEKEAQRRGIDIHTHIPVATRRTMLDPQLIKGAILNILINAMEASGGEGDIDLTILEADGRVILKVADNGEGMPAEIADRVFDPYFTTKASGTGLGLSLTKTIVEKHGGELSIENKGDSGAIVTIAIPIQGEGT